MNDLSNDNNYIKKNEREFIVSEPLELLKFLLVRLTDKSRNNIKSLLKRGQVKVNNKTVTQYNTLLYSGQFVAIGEPTKQGTNNKSIPSIIYEDESIIAINKPSGLLTIATDKIIDKTAYRMVSDYVRKANSKSRIFVIHRLDRDTSGIIIFAKNESTKKAFQDDWDNTVAVRGYTAIVEGQLKDKNGTIKSWLKETKSHVMYSSSREGEGQESITNYNVIKESLYYSLLDIRLQTGRKNQIRVHFGDIGHCIAGDKKYGASTDPLSRLCLHANKLEFVNPITNKKLCLESKYPPNFNSLFLNNNKSNN